MFSRREIVDNILSATRQDRVKIGSLVEDYLNITLAEINAPGWAFRKEHHHLWSFLKGKTSFPTVKNQEAYVMPREVSKIAVMRQETTPSKIYQVTDEQFYRLIPKPSSTTGTPIYYRIWDFEGVSTRLAAADTIDVVSSSTSDSGSSAYTVTIVGYKSTGVLHAETYTLNGTTKVTGSTTFAAREIWISKRAATNGDITVTRGTSPYATLLVMGKEDRAPRFRIISLYPIPSAVITIYIEYYSTIRPLTNDSDSPNMPSEYIWVVRLGAISKVYGEYLKDPVLGPLYESRYRDAVRAMVASDMTEPDLIEHLEAREAMVLNAVKRSDDAIA